MNEVGNLKAVMDAGRYASKRDNGSTRVGEGVLQMPRVSLSKRVLGLG